MNDTLQAIYSIQFNSIKFKYIHHQEKLQIKDNKN